MKKILHSLVIATLLISGASVTGAEPLRVFIRAGVKTHGPNQHDHPRFLADWTKLLADRGMKVEGDMDFPEAAQLEKTDVLVIYAQDGMKIAGEQRTDLEVEADLLLRLRACSARRGHQREQNQHGPCTVISCGSDG